MPVKIIMPKVDMVMETGTFMEWLKQEGDLVQKGDPLFVIMTDKSAIECDSPGSGKLAGLRANKDDVIPVTAVIGYILQQGESLADIHMNETASKLGMDSIQEAKILAAEQVSISSKAEVEDKDTLLRATPLARRTARNLGINLATIQGRGVRGRIYQADVKLAAESPPGADSAQIGIGKVATGPDLAIPLPYARIRERVALTGPRAIIAQRMSYSASTIPHIYLSVTVDAGTIFDLREAEKDRIQQATGRKLTYTAIMAFILSRVLPYHPFLNSSLNGDEIILWEDINLGLATDLGDYLIVPVIQRAQQRDLEGITAEMGSLLDDARNRRLNPEKMRHGTFTISNLGMYGIDSFTAIINPPEAAILAMGRIAEMPLLNGTVYRTMNLVLGADHRVVDGGKAATFLTGLKSALEEPAQYMPK